MKGQELNINFRVLIGNQIGLGGERGHERHALV